MTRVEARITVRMLGVLVVGLSIVPAWSSVLWIPKMISIMHETSLSGVMLGWTWPVGFVMRAVFFPMCVVFGIVMLLRAEQLRVRLFPEAEA